MSEMVERVARAIEREALKSLSTDETDEKVYEKLARAAIAAMREPPKGYEKIVYHGDYGDDVWCDMIDRALK